MDIEVYTLGDFSYYFVGPSFRLGDWYFTANGCPLSVGVPKRDFLFRPKREDVELFLSDHDKAVGYFIRAVASQLKLHFVIEELSTYLNSSPPISNKFKDLLSELISDCNISK